MSILIHGLSLPPRGKVNLLVMFDDGTVQDNSDGQNQWRAIELPPHGRLIDADAFEKHMSDTVMGDIRGYPYDGDTFDLAFSWLDHADTIIPAEEE